MSGHLLIVNILLYKISALNGQYCLRQSSFKYPKSSKPSQSSSTEITVLRASRWLASKLCFLCRTIQGSVIKSKCLRKATFYA